MSARVRAWVGGLLIARTSDAKSATLVERVRHLVPIALTLALLLLVVAAIASTYVGHSRSPYDTCYGPNGRAISCSVLDANR